MAFDLSKIARGPTLAPPRLFLYGPHGIGKTTFAACAPSPFILQLEDGEGQLSVPRHLVRDGWDEVTQVLGALAENEHDFISLGIDSIDWLEPVVWKETCRRNGWKDIESPGFGKGYIAADEVWQDFFHTLSYLRTQKNMQVILLGHSEIKTFNDPEMEPYDRYQPKLQKRACALVQEWADAVLFANYKSHVVSTDGSFGKKTTRGIGSGKRVMYTEERPSHYAKNRYALPFELPLSYPDFSAAMSPQTAVA